MRRTSLRDKTLTTKKDAVEEARLRLQAQEATDTTTSSSSTSTNTTTQPGAADLPNGYGGYHNNNNNNINNNSSSGEKRPSTGSSQNGLHLSHSKSADAVDNMATLLTTTHSYQPRRPPDGRENDEQQLQLKAGAGCESGEMQRATSAAAVILTDKGTAASAEAVQIQSSKEAGNGKINVQVTVLVGE